MRNLANVKNPLSAQNTGKDVGNLARPPVPKWPLGLHCKIASIEEHTKQCLQNCIEGSDVFGLRLNLAKVTEIILASAAESFQIRMEYYESDRNFCAEWLPEVIEETVTATLELTPLAIALKSRYRTGVTLLEEKLYVALQAMAETRLKCGQSRSSGAAILRGFTASGDRTSSKPRTRRDPRYQLIDGALRKISEARPQNHAEVFRYLQEWRTPVPNRKPFRTAGGWLKGFQQNRASASVWLSQAWKRLDLPSFARGPQK